MDIMSLCYRRILTLIHLRMCTTSKWSMNLRALKIMWVKQWIRIKRSTHFMKDFCSLIIWKWYVLVKITTISVKRERVSRIFVVEFVETKEFHQLNDYPSDFKFDLVMHDLSIGSCLLPFLHKFNYPPLISVTAYGHPSFLNDLVGGHHYYAYVPHDSLPFDDNMTFPQRFYNFLVFIWEKL